MRFTSLASSSAGNAYIVDDGKNRILLECGLTYPKLQKSVGFSLTEIRACLVSHEHKDHAKCAANLMKIGMDVYLSEGTAKALELEQAILIEAGEQFNIGTFDIMPFATFHDAAEPLGFLIKSRVDGETLVFATDTVNLRYRFPEVTILAIEANYDKHILERCERMPEKVRHRITNSHMEIGTLCDYLSGLDLSACREIYLLHLSDATSHEREFLDKVRCLIPPQIVVKVCGK